MFILWKKLVTAVLLILLMQRVTTLESENDENSKIDPNYRLPTDIVPTEYFIHLSPHVATSNFTFDGTAKIFGKVKKSTSKIVLHVDQVHVAGVNVFKRNEDGSTEILKVVEVATNKKYQFLFISLLHPMTKGTIVNIEMFFSGKIYMDPYGFFGNRYKDEDGSMRWMFATHFQPSGARRVFPCFDEPALKAVFHMSIDVPKNFTALGNMPIKSVKNGLVTFEKTPPMSTYALAVAFGDFARVSTRARNVSYSVWSSHPVSDQLSFALSVAPAVVDFMERHLRVPFGLEKLDILAMPDFSAKGMENWGLVVMNEVLTLYDPARTSLSEQKSVRNLIAHEVAHHWFGNPVTARWWDCIWLNEAFASYFEYYAHKDAFKSWNLETDFVVNYMQDGFGFDAYNDSHPLINPVYSSSEVNSMFDPISYKKGASLVRMLEKLVGSKIFYGALRRYLNKNKYSTGDPESLYASFEEEIKSNHYSLNMSITKLMDSWTLQSGHPVIDAQFNEDSVTLSQSRFFLQNEENPNDQSLWVVPINWASRSDPNFNVTNKILWMTEKSTVIHLDNAETDWFIFNIQQMGFYRVNYDKKMWKRITEALKSKEFEVIPEVNRASLLNDLFNLGRAGLLDYDTILTASQYLSEDKNYFPWRSAFSEWTYLNKRFTGHSEIMNYFNNYIASLVGKNYDRLGFYEKANDSALDIFLRELVLKLLCYIEHEDCVRNALHIFDKMKTNESFIMSPNDQAVVFCTAIKHGPPEYWNVLAERYEKSNAAEKLNVLYGFSCSGNSSQLESLLQKMIDFDSGIRKQDAKQLVSYIAENSAVGVQALMNFTEANLKKIADYFTNDDMISEICGTIADVVSIEELVLKFKEFLKNNSNKSSAIDESFAETAEIELNWYETNAPKILQWLNAHYPSKNFKSFSNI